MNLQWPCLKTDRLWFKEFQGWDQGTQITGLTGAVPVFITRASDPGGTDTDLAEAASDGKSLCPDSSLVVHGREAGQGACYELLRLLVPIHDPRQWAPARHQS